MKWFHFLLGSVAGAGAVLLVLARSLMLTNTPQLGVSLPDLTPYQPPPPPVEIIFAGDLMMDRYLRQKAIEHSSYDYLLEDVKPTLLEADLVVANLEGPITDSPSRSLGSEFGSADNFIFTMDPQVTEVLFRHQIWLVNLGNNHIFNFGRDGYRQTQRYLDEAGVGYFGYTGEVGDKVGVVWQFDQLKLGLVNYNQFAVGGLAAALDEITALRDECDVLVVYTHWGNEYLTTAGPTIQNVAHQFVDHGADAVIGSHPHVVQQREEYQGKVIYYSLGNFVFDQYFSGQTKNGLLVRMSIEPAALQLQFKELPITMDISGQTTLSEDTASSTATP
jgi:poly-gamma-glutamate synthesis protein (capsule biosynthesis protein)